MTRGTGRQQLVANSETKAISLEHAGTEYKKELIEQVIELTEHVNGKLHSGPLEQWKGLDLTFPQVRTLALLLCLGPIRMSNIAGYLGSTLSATTGVVDRLVDKGFVERLSDPDDRRVVKCDSTALGQETMERFWGIGRERILQIAELLDTEQLEDVIRTFTMLSDVTQTIFAKPESVPPPG